MAGALGGMDSHAPDSILEATSIAQGTKWQPLVIRTFVVVSKHPLRDFAVRHGNIAI